MRCSRLHSRSHSAWAFDIASRVLAGGFDGGLRKEPTPRGEMVGDRGCAFSQARLRAAESDAAMAAKICYPIVVPYLPSPITLQLAAGWEGKRVTIGRGAVVVRLLAC